MLLGIAAAKKDSIFYYCYNEHDFRVKGRRASETQRIVKAIADSLNVDLSSLYPIPTHFEFQKGDLVDPFLLGGRILPKGEIKPDLLGWNADLYLKFSNSFRFSYPFKSYKVITAWKGAECFKYYNDVVLHPAITANSLSADNTRNVGKEDWDALIEDLTVNQYFNESFFSKYTQKELTLILLPHPTSRSVNFLIRELANELIALQSVKQVVVKLHPNADSRQTNLFNFQESTKISTYFFEPKEMPAEILVKYFENNFTLGVPSGAHAENPPDRAFIVDCEIDAESKLWSLYYSKFYSLTGHRIESKVQISKRIRFIK
jgi:hypothetical protein